MDDHALGGLGRTIRLAKAFRLEQTDPEFFYTVQAEDAVAQSARYLPLPGRVVLDVGGGGGYFTRAFNAAGAFAVLVDPFAGRADGGTGEGAGDGALPAEEAARRARHAAAIRPGLLAPGRTIAGDGYRLPVRPGSVDLVFSSNVLEHVPDTAGMVDELVRVARPGGLIYLSFTTWYSLWGGHETAPWHFLGGERAARRYERLHGRPPGNRFGESLFARHAGTTLRHLRRRDDVTIVDALPRYHPSWLRWLLRVPAVREFAVWNLLVVLRRTAPLADRL